MKSCIHKFQYLRFDGRSVSLFRILLGISILYNLLFIKLPFTAQFWGEHTIIPVQVMQFMNGKDAFSTFDYIRNDLFAYGWMGTSILLGVLFTIGFRTRLISFLLLFFYFNILQAFARYNPGFDKYTFQLLTWSCFLPLSSFFSIQKEDIKKQIPLWVSIILIVQLCWIYCCTGLAKYGEAWTDGYAVKIMASDIWNASGMASFFADKSWVYRPLTYLTLFFEVMLPFLILIPSRRDVLRYAAVIFLIAFHGSIFLLTDVGSFSITGIAAAGLLLPASFWDSIGYQKNADYMKPVGSKLKMLALTVLTAFILYVICEKNLLFLTKNSAWRNSASAKAAAHLLKVIDIPVFVENSFLFQNWKMFAPNPITEAGWLSIEYKGEDGILYDFFTDEIIPATRYKINFHPKGMEMHLLSYARAMHNSDKWYTRVFIKYWYFYQLALRKIPKSEYGNYYLAEYRYVIQPNDTGPVRNITKQLYDDKAMENISVSLPADFVKPVQ
ncbi:MAG: HTTM domain-containing protein [Sphingobacteriales bacterium]|nr:HTTM domain-containing protein [Sphingobacteriales bacterium]